MVKCIEEYVQVDDFKMYSKVFYESSYEEFMFSLGEADKHRQSMRNIPLVVVSCG